MFSIALEFGRIPLLAVSELPTRFSEWKTLTWTHVWLAAGQLTIRNRHNNVYPRNATSLSLSFYVPISLYSISFFLTSSLSFHPQTSLPCYDSVSVGLFVIFDPFSVFFLSLYLFFPLSLSLSVFALSSVLCVCWTARLACSKGNANRQLDRSRRLLFT